MAAATVDMNVLTRSFRSALGENAGQFRKASNDNAVNFSKIVKDISGMFKAQRGDITELTNAVQESVSESQQAAAKIDAQSSLIREGLSLQTEMRDYLKNISGNIKILNDSVVSMSNQMVSMGPNSLLGGILNPTTGVGSTIASALKTAGLVAGVGAGVLGANYLMGGGADAPGIKTSGNLAQNQQEAYKAARAEGLSESAAKIAVANVSGENLKNPGGVYADPSHRNPSQKAHGIVAWDDERSNRIKQVFGKYPQEMSVADQTKAYIWEMKTHYKQAYNDLVNENLSEQQRLASVVANFEKPADTASAVRNRMGFLRGFSPNETATPQATSATTPAAKTTPSKDQEAPPPSATSPRYEGPGAESHGPIGKEQHAQKLSSEAVTGKSLEGVNPALASAFIAAAEEFKQKTGRTVNINSALRSTAEQQILWDKKQRGEISYPVAQPGKSLHEKGLAIDIPVDVAAAMEKSGILAKHGLNRPVAGDPVHIQLMGSKEQEASGPTMQEAGIQQVAAAPVSPNIGPGVSAPIPQQAMGMMGGMMPMMGGMGGIGGMIGSLMPMVGSLLGSLGSMETPTAPQQFAQQQNPIAELLQSLSGAPASGEMMNQAAIQKQAQQESTQEMLAMAPQPEQRKGSETTIASNSMAGGGNGYAYNYPADVGWPEWASMIGGNHWSEMKKYKQNMWG